MKESALTGWSRMAGRISANGTENAGDGPDRLAPLRPVGRVVAQPFVHAPAAGALLFLIGSIYGAASFEGLVIMTIIIYVVASLGLNIPGGMIGQLNLGQGAAFAVGAYTAGILTVDHHWPIIGTLPAAFAAGVVVGLAIGAPAARLGLIGLAMVSLGLTLVVIDAATSLNITGGPNGLAGIIGPLIPGEQPLEPTGLLVMIIVVGVVVYLIHWWLRVSNWGRKALAVRNDQSGAVALGISQYTVKVIGCGIGTGIGAIAGALYAYSISAISPDAFGVQLSLLFLLMIVIGGAGTRLGPVFGGALLGLIPIYLAQYSPLNIYLYGVLLIFAVRLLPRGIVWRTGAPVGFTGRPKLPAVPRRGTEIDLDERTDPSAAAPAPQDREACLTVTDVSRSFGKLQALSHVSLTLDRGNTLGIVGPNGSGKTTLLNAVSGFYRPEGGEILLGGQRISGLSPTKIARRGVGRTFQVPRIFTYLTIDEHLALARRNAVRQSEAHTQLALEYLGSVGLLGRRSRREARGLSHGQNRFLEVGMAIMRAPEVLLLDEPAAGLSAAEVDQLSELIGNIARSGMSIVLVEHHIEMVRNVADKIAVLHLGEVLWQGAPDQLTESMAVRSAFLGAGAVL